LAVVPPTYEQDSGLVVADPPHPASAV